MSLPLVRLLPVWLLMLPALAFAQSGAQSGAKSGATPVIVAEARLAPMAERVEALGTLRANESVSITSNVTETVSAVHFDDGQRVREGDLLVEMTSAEEHALLEEAQARVAEAERQHRRVRSLVDQGSASESLLDERKRDLDTAQANLVALESRLADRVVRAPFDGIVGLRSISRGALVAPGDLITTLDDDGVMKLDFTVPSLYLAELRPGLRIEARARAYGERLFEGTVRGIDSRIDPVTRSVLVRALLPNPQRTLRPGLLMQVELLLNPRQTLVLPEAALLHQGAERFVLRLVDTDQGLSVERRAVQIGARQPGLVEILDGLAAGEQVVTEGQDKARPGKPVQVLAVDDGQLSLRDAIREGD
ncbi:efflux RND transporter periplasmic adaptor subunit [Thiohalocapsa marina]|uniref:Efflux RND transporter periplasmic adaptor subunit n=1 Tax=Thiohalocapsa marina TaxID=424902 RepID=A0A5M8FS41_9GAMM|nr:efflux RND transporter periplasmic adaptor subunit [Thiohalocapsa marina]